MARGIVLLISTLVLLSCADDPKIEVSDLNGKSEITQGTRQMIDSIQMIISKVNFRQHPYESSERLKLIEQELAVAKADNKLPIALYIEYGKILLNAGRSQESIDVFEDIMRRMPENRAITAKNKGLHDALAIAYMRLGEQVNCRDNHSAESCLFPIKGDGIHLDPNGSRKAISIYQDILRVFPQDLQSRWILNLAYMTLDEYPKNVPKEFLIPPSVFRPEYNLSVFENISMDLGLDINELAGGVITDDFDSDGLIDIMMSSWGLFGKLHYFRNKGDGTFEERTEAANLKGLTGGLNLIQADYNNDGHLDFFICRSAWSGYSWMGQLPNSLLKNNGDGTFEDVTIASGIYAPHPTQSAVWADFNMDGYLDLFIGNETHSLEEPNPCQLFLNQKDGTFRDIASESGVDFSSYVKGTAAGDINNDGFPDLYISILNGPNKLLLNKSFNSVNSLQFEDVTAMAGVAEPLESFPTWFFDFNNDGNEDLFVSCFDSYSLSQQAEEVTADYLNKKISSDLPRLYQNLGKGNFKDVTKISGLNHVLPTMGCNFGDLDNDGFPDFYLGTGAPDFRAIVPNRMFRNNAGKDFQDVTYSGNFGHIQKGHGIGFADFDNDGDQDIYAVMGGSVSGDIFQNAFFENPGTSNNSIIIRLTGTVSNRSAIGARIRLTVEENGRSRTIYHTINSGGSFGANSLQAEIGLGTADEVMNMEINWPNGRNNFVSYGGVKAGIVLTIREGDQEFQMTPYAPFPFKRMHHMTGN